MLGPEFQAFLRSAGVSPPGKSKSAEHLAFDLALRIAVAQAGDASASGLALDWSKCNDHLLLDLLHHIAAHVGIPGAIAKPMLAAYAQPRAVLLNGSIAPEKAPGGRPCSRVPSRYRLAGPGDPHVHQKPRGHGA